MPLSIITRCVYASVRACVRVCGNSDTLNIKMSLRLYINVQLMSYKRHYVQSKMRDPMTLTETQESMPAVFVWHVLHSITDWH